MAKSAAKKRATAKPAKKAAAVKKVAPVPKKAKAPKAVSKAKASAPAVAAATDASCSKKAKAPKAVSKVAPKASAPAAAAATDAILSENEMERVLTTICSKFYRGQKGDKPEAERRKPPPMKDIIDVCLVFQERHPSTWPTMQMLLHDVGLCAYYEDANDEGYEALRDALRSAYEGGPPEYFGGKKASK